MPLVAYGLLSLVLFASGGVLLRGSPRAQLLYGTAGLLAVVVLACGIALRRRHEWRGAQRLFWDTFVLGMVLWIIGRAGAVVDQLMHVPAGGVSWHALLGLCGGLGLIVAYIARPHRGVRAAAAGPLAVDLASYAMLGGFVYAYFLLAPTRSGIGSDRVLIVVAQAERAVFLAAAILIAIAGRRTNWGATYARITAGAVAADAAGVAVFGLRSGISQGGLAFDVVVSVLFLSVAWSAKMAPASPPSDAESFEAQVVPPSALLSAIPVFLVPALGFGLQFAQRTAEPGDAFRILLTTLTTVVGVGLLTVRLSVEREELQRVDARLKLLASAVEWSGDLILITRASGQIEHANDAFLRALGYERSELADKTFLELLEPGVERLGEHIPAEVRQHGVWRGSLVRRRRDGSTFPAACTVVGLRGAGGAITHFVGVERDITDELRMRDQLVHSERLSAVGELVAGMAHEINNPLQTIVGSIELLLDGDVGHDPTPDLETVKAEATRAAQIVRNLLAFVHRSPPSRVETDLNDVVRSTARIREYHLIRRNITLLSELAPEPMPVFVNRDELQQVLINLLLNAEQAIASEDRAGTILLRTCTEDGMHVFEICDDGPGVSLEARGRIFEPFYTTKDVGQGTGLGLSIAHGIATAHGGALELRDRPRGACFRLSLPAHIVAAA
ncbi:MAG TPA: ATP-binding protein [Vicinamibacterales bacterium]|nr:ATP-binding protein [Vicinamibacterales bacterium]